MHICCLAFREPPASGGGGGALKCLCELSARDEVFRQRTYLYGLYRLYLSDAAARAAQPVRAEADGGAEAAPPTQDRTSAAAAPDVPGAVPGAGGEAGVMGGARRRGLEGPSCRRPPYIPTGEKKITSKQSVKAGLSHVPNQP